MTRGHPAPNFLAGEDALISHLLHTYSRNISYIRRLVTDVPEDKMAFQPAPGMNHPAWVLGHLVVVGDMVAELLGKGRSAPGTWEALFGNSSKPTGDASAYPPKAELVEAVEKNSARISEGLAAASPEIFAQPLPQEEYRKHFPTIGDAVFYLLTFHDAVHLGQLSAWRRVQGMPSV